MTEIGVGTTRTNKMARVPQAHSYLDVKTRLMHDFPRVYSITIDKILQFHSGQYEKAYNSLTLTMNELKRKYPEFGKHGQRPTYSTNVPVINDKGETTILTIQTMARPRSCGQTISSSVDMNKKSTPIIKEQMSDKSFQEADRCLAMSLVAAEYEETGQFIQCECCFGDCVFDNMAQCMEGHLVCVQCLNSFAEESVFGAGKVSLNCMASECTAMYSEGELKRCLLEKTWTKLEERTLKESLNRANFEDLVVCPYCDFAAILSPRIKIFRCFRDKCNKRTCRDCGVDWTDHEGLTCAAVETKDETSVRKEFEEKMTKAKVRTCVTCKTDFTKESGCNKMTCRCGATICYICRTPNITYEHFCRHARDPGKNCTICKACSLWTNPEVDDERALQEVKKESEAKQIELGFQNVREYGIPTVQQK